MRDTLLFNDGNTLVNGHHVQIADFTPAAKDAEGKLTPAILVLTIHGHHHTYNGSEAEKAFGQLSDE